MEFLQGHCLALQVRTDAFGHAGFRSVGSRYANGSHHPTIQVMQDMALVPIDANTATFAPMPHLSILHTDASIFGHSFDKSCLACLPFLDMLRFDLLGYLHILLCFRV